MTTKRHQVCKRDRQVFSPANSWVEIRPSSESLFNFKSVSSLRWSSALSTVSLSTNLSQDVPCYIVVVISIVTKVVGSWKYMHSKTALEKKILPCGTWRPISVKFWVIKIKKIIRRICSCIAYWWKQDFKKMGSPNSPHRHKGSHGQTDGHMIWNFKKIEPPEFPLIRVWAKKFESPYTFPNTRCRRKCGRPIIASFSYYPRFTVHAVVYWVCPYRT